MDLHRENLRYGVWALILVALLWLTGPGSAPHSFLQRECMSLLVYLQSGRWVSPANGAPPESPGPETVPPETETEAPSPAEKPVQPPAPYRLTEADEKAIEVQSMVPYDPDFVSILRSPLSWDLTGPGPKVLIVHTHATESYTPSEGEKYKESSAYRTLDDRYNMVSVGDEVTRLLEAGGISVLHDRAYHDYPSYNGSYSDARKSISYYLKKYPTICMVLDLHRDAVELDGEKQLSTHATVDGEPSAQLMMVTGTDVRWRQPHWQKNLGLALKLMAVLEKRNPGICRPTQLREQRFNQDTSPGCMLVEIGANGNTHTEALRAAKALAQGILDLAHGTENG